MPFGFSHKLCNISMHMHMYIYSSPVAVPVQSPLSTPLFLPPAPTVVSGSPAPFPPACWSNVLIKSSDVKRRVPGNLALKCWFNSLSLEFLELSNRAAQHFWRLLLPQLLRLCLQVSQLLLQSLRDTNGIRHEPKQGQSHRTRRTEGSFILIWEKVHTSIVLSLTKLLCCAACRFSSTFSSIISFSWILWTQ